MQKLCDCLQVLVDVKHEVILPSDFNLPNISWFDNGYPTGLCETLFYDFVTNNGFSQFVENATDSVHVLDLVFYNDPLGVLNCNVCSDIFINKNEIKTKSFRFSLTKTKT